MSSAARRWAAGLLELFLPTGCISCRSWIPARGDERPPLVCDRCRARMRRGPWPRCARCHAPRGTGRSAEAPCRVCADWPDELAHARYAFELAPPVDDLVHGLKYEGWRELAAVMGAQLARVELPVPPAGAVVVPVPTTPERLAARGYNQAELLAREVAERRRWPLVAALARPGRAAGSQTSLTPRERAINVRGAFVPGTRAEAVAGRPVVLVDDVLTTGATAGEAARMLASLGSGPVLALSYARATGRIRAAA